MTTAYLDYQILEGLLSEKQCCNLRNWCFQNNKFTSSTTVDSKDKVSRYSETTSIYPNENKLIDNLREGLASISKIPISHQEPAQIQYYPHGGYYKPHLDYFFNAGKTGLRILTFMVYLNTVNNGGRTIFSRMNLAVRPIAGRAVYWSNLDKNGNWNPDSLHESEETHEPKLVLTIWIRKYAVNEFSGVEKPE